MTLDLAIINHPVHIINEKNQVSPSAFIPFCEFGGNVTAMAVKIEHLDPYVCNSFQAKVQNNQLCYEVDLNKYSDKNNIDRELTLGFVFIMDYNEDRQVTLKKKSRNKKSIGLTNKFIESDRDKHATIYLETIGWYFIKVQTKCM